jgi:putative nucleotidyltransferase with HDIG domain
MSDALLSSAREGTTWVGADAEWLAGIFTLPLQHEFGAGRWLVITGQARHAVYAPTAGFLRQFALVVAVGLVVVALLTLSQLRRNLGPFERLHEATRRLAGRDFSTPVEVDSRDEFGELAAAFNDMRGQLHRQFQTLSTVAELDVAILSTFEPERIVATLLDRLPSVVRCSMASLSVVDPDLGTPTTAVRRAGMRTITCEPATETHLPFELLARHEWAEGLRENLPPIVARALAAGAVRALTVPVVVNSQLAGVIAIGRNDDDSFTADDHAIVEQLANQTAVALSNAALVRRLDRLNLGALNALALAIDAKSSWTAGHSKRVTELGLALGRALDLDARTLDVLRRGGLLHDIGKIGIPAAILDKPGRLTPDETRVMRQHPELGARILAPIPEYAEVIPIVAEHHERYDGSGYPHALAGTDISLGGRIFAVADVYDALTSQRPYRDGLPPARAIEIVRAGRGSHFDPEIADAFVRMMAERSAEVPLMTARAS